MATTPRDDPFTARPALGADLGVDLLPLPDEAPEAYLSRLRALHARVGALIRTIEERRPALGGAATTTPGRITGTRRPPLPALPPQPRRTQPERRDTAVADRRVGAPDRRVGLPDARPVPINRRFGPRDRRRAPLDRRDEQFDRRRDPSPVPWQGRLRLDGTTMMWVLQIAAWVTFAALALIYGIGR